MGIWNKKKKKTNWGEYYRSEYEFDAMRWCINRDIKIGPMAAEGGEAPNKFKIDITIKGQRSQSPEIYLAKEVWPQIYKYYIYYYEKYRNSIP